MTNNGKKVIVRELCIYYLVQFLEGQEQVRVLFDINSKINTMSPAYIIKLIFKTWKTNVGAQKINGSSLEIFGMVITDFQVEDKGSRPKFF